MSACATTNTWDKPTVRANPGTTTAGRLAEVFADTSGWGSYFVRTETFHTEAVDLIKRWRSNGTRLITTNYVLTEMVALFTRPLRVPRRGILAAVDAIKSEEWVEVIHIDPLTDAAAWDLLKQRPDKEWSLVDASSFVVLGQRMIADALTSDHHFE